jgi:hypothetical protein
MTWFAIVVGTIVCCLLCGRVAERRGRSDKLWVALGAVFGPVALLLAAQLPRRHSERCG